MKLFLLITALTLSLAGTFAIIPTAKKTTVSSQKDTTVILAPLKNTSEVNIIGIGRRDDTRKDNPDIAVEAWTQNDIPYTVRGAIKFDFSLIPEDALIKSARLYLYSYPSPTLNGNLENANVGNNNGIVVQRITDDWQIPGISWFNQPRTTRKDEIKVPHTSTPELDLELNVPKQVRAMISEKRNYGFMIRLQKERIYNSRIFVSSHSPAYPGKRPKLEIVYEDKTSMDH